MEFPVCLKNSHFIIIYPSHNNLFSPITILVLLSFHYPFLNIGAYSYNVPCTYSLFTSLTYSVCPTTLSYDLLSSKAQRTQYDWNNNMFLNKNETPILKELVELTWKIIFPVERNKKAKQISRMNILMFSLQPSNFVMDASQGGMDVPQQENGSEFDQSLKV